MKARKAIRDVQIFYPYSCLLESFYELLNLILRYSHLNFSSAHNHTPQHLTQLIAYRGTVCKTSSTLLRPLETQLDNASDEHYQKKTLDCIYKKKQKNPPTSCVKADTMIDDCCESDSH